MPITYHGVDANWPRPTLDQIAALARLWQRDIATRESNLAAGIAPGDRLTTTTWPSFAACLDSAMMQSDGSLAALWAQMWLGIERDGYIHS